MTKSQATKPQADILIVDDTPNNLRLLGQILGKQYKVRLAPSGQIALTAARSAPPDLILLDIMMPELDGYEVANQLKAEPQTKEIPILFISALDDTDSKVRAFAAGGVDYITKPFQEKEVLVRVATHLSLRRLYRQAQEELAERKRAEKNVQRMVERWSIVYRASEEISASLDTEQVFAAVYHAIEQIMPCEDFVISLYDEIRNEMSGSYILENKQRVAPSPYKADHGLGGYIVHSGKPLILNTPEQIKTSGIRFEPYGNGPVTSSVLAVPMQIKGKTIGILSVQSYHSEVYTTEDQELLEMFAGHVAIAIDHARVFEQAQQEIAERKRAEEALRESEEKYRKIFNNEIDAICIFDLDTKRILDVNTAYLKLYGYTRDEVLQLTIDDISAEQEETNSAVQKARATGDVVIPERRHRKKDGTVFHVELSAGAYTWKGRNVMFAIARDITERKQAEDALRASTAKLEILFQVSPLAITMLDSKGIVQFWNTAAEKIFGWTAEEVIGHPNPIVPADKQTEYTAWSAQILHGEPITNQETIRQRKDGSIVNVSISSSPVYDSAGNVIGRMAIIADNTERKQAEDELRRVNTLMNMVVENIPNMIFLKDAKELRFVRFNRAGEELLGYSREDLLGKNDYDFFPKEQANFFTAKDREVLSGNEVVDIPEEPLQTRNKGMRTLHTKKVPLHDVNGEPEYLLGISEDITERKQAEESLLRRNHEMATLYETSLEINTLSDVSALLLAIVRRACELLKIPSGALYLARPDEEVLELVVEHQLPPHWVGIKIQIGEGVAGRVVQTKKPVVVEDYLTWGGRLDAFSDSPARRVLGVPLKIHDQITGVIVLIDRQVGMFSDDEIRLASLFADQAAIAVTNAQFAAQLEEHVSQRTSELEEANRELESLSYNIAHDMRSPVRTMVGYSSMLQQLHRAQLDSEGQQLLEQIQASGVRLGQMIDGFLTFLHLGHANLHLQPVNMNNLVSQLVRDLEPNLKDRRVEFNVGDLPDCQADPKLIEQVWTQLISNSLKFTRPREVACIEIGSGRTNGKPYYFVHDNGVGFDMKYSAKLFGIFQKLHYESEFEGTGIGLAIIKRIIQRHGGKVWVEAEVDKGAAFFFMLTS